MTRIRSFLTVVLLAFAISAPASAGIGLSGRAGTLGLGIEATQSLVPMINVRGGINWFSYSFDGTESDVRYNSDLQLKSFSALVDFHPFPLVGFRLTGGIVFNSNGLEMQSESVLATIEIGGKTYTQAEAGTLNGNVDFESTAPYLGIGWGNAANSRIGLALDLGIAFQGSPQVELGATGQLRNNSDFISELNREQNDLQDALDGFKYYPVISVGLSFKITP